MTTYVRATLLRQHAFLSTLSCPLQAAPDTAWQHLANQLAAAPLSWHHDTPPLFMHIKALVAGCCRTSLNIPGARHHLLRVVLHLIPVQLVQQHLFRVFCFAHGYTPARDENKQRPEQPPSRPPHLSRETNAKRTISVANSTSQCESGTMARLRQGRHGKQVDSDKSEFRHQITPCSPQVTIPLQASENLHLLTHKQAAGGPSPATEQATVQYIKKR